MSDRRQQRRQERQRRRRQDGSDQTSYQPVAGPEFPGIMGVMQRNARFLLLGGVVVMVLSLGSIFFVTQLGGASPHTGPGSSTSGTSDSGDETPDPVASGEPTGDATSDDPSGDPSNDEPAIVRSYSAAPLLEIDPELSYEAIIELESGEVRLELLPAEAPGYVNNFVFLARNQFYDGLTFHRVVPGFVAQGGDPTGNGAGSAGYNLVEESNSITFGSGVLSMAKAGPTVNGSQFFITLGPAPHLDSGFTVFGRVIEGLELLQAFDERNPASSDEPGPTIISIEIIEGS